MSEEHVGICGIDYSYRLRDRILILSEDGESLGSARLTQSFWTLGNSVINMKVDLNDKLCNRNKATNSYLKSLARLWQTLSFVC